MRAMSEPTTAFVVMTILLIGCRHPEPIQKPREADLRQRIVGTWWSGDQWITEPFSFVTFYPDGRFTRSSTNGPIGAMPNGYWRVTNKTVTMTVGRDALPADSLQIFTIDRITDHGMVFTNSIEKLRIGFTR